MKFECGDLDRALENSQLMPEAREHLKHCAACRKEYRLWNEISSTARELHEEWESPALWPAINATLRSQPKPARELPWWANQRTWMLAAAALVVVAAVIIAYTGVWRPPPAPRPEQAQAQAKAAAPSAAPPSRVFLTEQALAEVERTEAAYRQSIDKLSGLAEAELRKPHSAAQANCKEKLKLLDSAIAETRANLDQNRYNVHLQTALADLYREKKETLQELLTRDEKN